MSLIIDNLTTLLQHFRESEIAFHRPPGSVQLLAVSKNQPVEAIQQAIEAGQLAFGENYLQEALPKIAALSYPGLEWHFVGRLQTNKAQKIAAHFNWVHTVENIHIAQRLNKYRPKKLGPLNICLQVNTSHELTKAGAHFDEVLSLAKTCLTLPNLRLRGLMALPRPYIHFIDQRAEFYKLNLVNKILIEHGIILDTLSMGTSADWKAAIAEGSTLVRIGRAMFNNFF